MGWSFCLDLAVRCIVVIMSKSSKGRVDEEVTTLEGLEILH